MTLLRRSKQSTKLGVVCGLFAVCEFHERLAHKVKARETVSIPVLELSWRLATSDEGGGQYGGVRGYSTLQGRTQCSSGTDHHVLRIAYPRRPTPVAQDKRPTPFDWSARAMSTSGRPWRRPECSPRQGHPVTGRAASALLAA